ncbi:MAG: hypothetical protein Q9217_005142 [Psora testacea]
MPPLKLGKAAVHEGCGPQHQRKPYLLSKVTEDSKDLTTFLAAQLAPWSEVAPTYFGKTPHYTQIQKLKGRGLFEDFADGVGDIIDGVRDVIDGVSNELSKSVSFDLNVRQKGQRTNVYTYSTGRLKLDCINCYVAGTIEVTTHLSGKKWHLKDFSIDTSPHGLEAQLELEASITAPNAPDSLQHAKELWSAPLQFLEDAALRHRRSRVHGQATDSRVSTGGLPAQTSRPSNGPLRPGGRGNSGNASSQSPPFPSFTTKKSPSPSSSPGPDNESDPPQKASCDPGLCTSKLIRGIQFDNFADSANIVSVYSTEEAA